MTAVDTRDVVADLSALLPGLHLRWVRRLAIHGVRSLADMQGWTMDDLRDVQQMGVLGRAETVRALRAAGVVVGPGARGVL